MATIVDNGNSQSSIKLTIINTKIPIEANSVLFDSERLYTIWRFVALLVSLYPLYPGGPLDIDELKYPLLNSLFRVIKTLAAGVYNKNRQSDIQFAIINTTIPTKTLSIFYDIERLYTFSRVCAFGS